MTQREQTIIDQSLKGINLRMIWALIICTAVSVSAVLTIYYGFKTDQAIMKIQMQLMEQRLNKLENAK